MNVGAMWKQLARPTLARWLSLSTAFAAASATATWLSGAELERYCDGFLADAASSDGAACVAFVQGFIAGSAAAERAGGGRASGSSPPTDTFAERAAQTRAGNRLRNLLRERGRYCIDESMTAATVVERVSTRLRTLAADGSADAAEGGEGSAERLLHSALVASFPCDGG
jgi:hypothetical protein